MALMARRRGRAGAALARVASLGYAVPGPVVAIGVVVTLASLDRRGWVPGGVLLVGSLVGLVYGLVVRFLAVGYQGVDAGLSAVPAHTVDSARTLGARPWRVALRVELPQARAALLAAAALVAVDTVKELPITLLLRPFGTDTLSVWVWQATSESLWVQAALPSLAIVAVGMVPVAALLWALERGARVTS
jgi:iron(III) transport system permease protein